MRPMSKLCRLTVTCFAILVELVASVAAALEGALVVEAELTTSIPVFTALVDVCEFRRTATLNNNIHLPVSIVCQSHALSPQTRAYTFPAMRTGIANDHYSHLS